MLARHDEKVHRRLRIDIAERDASLVLIHALRRNLSFDDFAEEAIHHGTSVCHVRCAREATCRAYGCAASASLCSRSLTFQNARPSWYAAFQIDPLFCVNGLPSAVVKL